MSVRMPRRKDLPPHWRLPAAILLLAAMLSFAAVVIVFAPLSISPRWLAWPTAVGLIALGIACELVTGCGVAARFRVHAEDEHGYVDVSNAALFEVPHDLLEVGDTGRHHLRECPHRDYLDAHVYVPEFPEDGHLGADVVHHERVLPELNFDANLILDEIHLAISPATWRCARVVSDIELGRVFARYPYSYPPTREETLLECCVERVRAVEHLPRHRLLFAFLGHVLARVNARYDCLDITEGLRATLSNRLIATVE